MSSLKGGTGKTTSAVCLSLGLARRGHRVLLVDSDGEQQSSLKWSERAESWPTEQVTVIAWSGRDLGRRIRAVADDYDSVIVDTGPSNRAVLAGALGATGRLLVPCGPRSLDVAELRATLDIASEVDQVTPVFMNVLLTMVRLGTRSADDVRDVLETDLGYPLLKSVVPLRETYAHMFASTPDNLGAYDDVLEELLADDTETVRA
ncbi:AAA family ATPase [Rhodococcus sp. NPDC057529]|uniref:AAA family ATPase n=1 Tax=Rhodococcus sp. NPDC057529 TaxID=3346158 RepID=UPI00366D9D19